MATIKPDQTREAEPGMRPAPVRLAARGDRDAVAAMLARAFHDDPAFAWMVPDDARRPARIAALFRLLFESDARAGMRLVSPDLRATTLWRAPGRQRQGAPSPWDALRLTMALGGAIGRAQALGAAIEAHMPAGDFWYLHIAGVDPAGQGQGLGGRLVRAGLDRAAGRLPCYLETAKERNLPFYANLGFAVTGEWRVGADGPRFWSMLRPSDG